MHLNKQTPKKQSNRNQGSECQFPGKLHGLMSFVERENLESIICWVMNGHAIMINDPEKLVQILPLFFGQTKYRSFRRQLNMWHFERILEGPYKGAFMHPYFVRGNKMLCTHMSRHAVNDVPISSSLTQKLSMERNCQTNFHTNFHSSNNDVMIYPIDTTQDVVSMATAAAEAVLNVQPCMMGPIQDSSADEIKDGDVVNFAGKKFYFVDSIPCRSSPEPSYVHQNGMSKFL